MIHVSVDPYPWLKPIYARFRSAPVFARLVPALQYVEVCRAASEDSAPKAASMLEWNALAHIALLKHLADSIDELPNPSSRVELWRVRKDTRMLRCVAVNLSHGVDLRLMEAENFRPRELIKDAERETLEAKWRVLLFERGRRDEDSAPEPPL